MLFDFVPFQPYDTSRGNFVAGPRTAVAPPCSPPPSNRTANTPAHSQSTQASPTGSLRPRRPRARSADESNKNLLSPRESLDDWVIHADEILIGPRIGMFMIRNIIIHI